jgi:branched-chain amino acid transport system ATP-binding protein
MTASSGAPGGPTNRHDATGTTWIAHFARTRPGRGHSHPPRHEEQRDRVVTSQAPVLAVRELALSFGGLKALNHVSFEVSPGSITSIIGPNGAGKTSLFNTVSGFYRPSAGRIEYRGNDITGISPPKRAKLGLARSFQNIALFRGMTVLDNIKLGRHCHLRSNLIDALIYFGRARREEMLLRTDIEERIIDFLEIDHIRHAPVATCARNGALPS